VAAIGDYEIDMVKNSAVAVTQSADNGIATATHAALPLRHWVAMKCDASYSTSTVTGELTILFGTTVIARKHIHGAGAIDFGMKGHQNPDAAELIEAKLAAGGAGVFGDLTFTAFHTGPNA